MTIEFLTVVNCVFLIIITGHAIAIYRAAAAVNDALVAHKAAVAQVTDCTKTTTDAAIEALRAATRAEKAAYGREVKWK